jgi:hypothetical protein
MNLWLLIINFENTSVIYFNAHAEITIPFLWKDEIEHFSYLLVFIFFSVEYNCWGCIDGDDRS